MNKKRAILSACSAVILGLSVVACSNQTVRDLEGVPVSDPDKSRLVVNIDKYPNINAICINGAGFATTTRPDARAFEHIPVWDAPDGWCGTGVPK